MTSSNSDRPVFNSDWDQYIDGWDGVTGQAPAVLSVYLQAHSSGFTSVAQSVSLENSVTIQPVTDVESVSHRDLRDTSTVDRSPLTTGNVVHDLSVGGNVPMGQLPTGPGQRRMEGHRADRRRLPLRDFAIARAATSRREDHEAHSVVGGLRK